MLKRAEFPSRKRIELFRKKVICVFGIVSVAAVTLIHLTAMEISTEGRIFSVGYSSHLTDLHHCHQYIACCKLCILSPWKRAVECPVGLIRVVSPFVCNMWIVCDTLCRCSVPGQGSGSRQVGQRVDRDTHRATGLHQSSPHHRTCLEHPGSRYRRLLVGLSSLSGCRWVG